MGKNKIQRFAELHTFPNVIETEFNEVFGKAHPLKGNWHEQHFKNNNPIVLELGCGKGEYTLAMAENFPNKNFIGIDIKGNRIWVGAHKALSNKLINVCFLRTRIDFIESFFGPDEVEEIWITFPDPQPQSNRKRKRLTSPLFLNRYKKFLKRGGIIHLKTDNELLYSYTLEIIENNHLPLLASTDNLYQSVYRDELAGQVQTYYENIFLSAGKRIHYLRFTLDGVDSIV
ncbi:MAG TPA: tRNA (guanosine(46)-N7)-methyltransferase TrmB [Bacteroidales bacterium]|nr:tRNA (guanosine(46)-N7)-methyltransferase TrmB [Bacteroidales bacterium]HOK98306.1 tRNA (guanosine(46)-N7)-methyltransferase TrmB [Bacteroidales bacterium]HPO65138.1 tRNA (guanosine(46)-N7)-methyltransferase TrmB [Bacteroidales bacterium]